MLASAHAWRQRFEQSLPGLTQFFRQSPKSEREAVIAAEGGESAAQWRQNKESSSKSASSHTQCRAHARNNSISNALQSVQTKNADLYTTTGCSSECSDGLVGALKIPWPVLRAVNVTSTLP
eukprot:6196141-Pleurochrysis_carterae.AAC.4